MGEKRNSRRAAAFLALATASLSNASSAGTFRGRLYGEVSSGYLSSGGSLGDTRPVAVNRADWSFNSSEYGEISGYFWTISSLHDSQRHLHREAFNQFETAVYYGYVWSTGEVAWHGKTGPLWNPMIGYKGGHNCELGWHFVARAQNGFAVPYVNALWMFEPYSRTRIRLGIEKGIAVGESWRVTPFVEAVWMDRARYVSRYGAPPNHGRILGGVFAVATFGVKVTYALAENLNVFARVRQYDMIDAQARRAVRRKNSYYAKCDCPVAGIGLEFSF